MTRHRNHHPLRLAALLGALCAAASPALAQSNVALNGVIDLFAGQRQLAGQTAVKKLDSGGLTTSRIALEGSEDLGGGLKAQFVLSGFLRGDTGEAGRTATEGFWRRMAYVGLSGNFGSLRLGRVNTPTFGNTIRFNPFADSTTFAPVMLHTFTGGQPLAAPMNSPDSAADNAVAYSTPNLSGFNATLMWSAGETVGKGNRTIAGGSYAVGAFAIGLAGERVQSPGALPSATDEIKHLQGGASYDFGVVKLFGQQLQSKLALTSGKQRQVDTTQLGASAPLGAGTLMLSWAGTKVAETGAADLRRRTVGLGYDHFLSKRTDVYAVALKDSVSNLADGKTLAVGIRHRF